MYDERVHEVERRNFSPLVFSLASGNGQAAMLSTKDWQH